jgi:protease-4
MTLEADTIIARRRLKRSLSLWRVIAVVAVVAALLALGLAGGEPLFDLGKSSDHIARIKISGLITGDEETLKLIDKLKDSKRVKAVIVRINSPGGTTAGSEALYERLRRLAEAKPVTAVMDTVAASGGYITAIAADHIVARGNTITGSIGVIFQWAEIRKLLDTLGVRVEEIKSGDMKAEPSMFTPLSDKVRTVTEAMVEDSFRWFTGLVAERRKLDSEAVARISDGRVFTGRQALEARLIDEIGGEDRAIEWLSRERQIEEKLKVLDWEPEKTDLASGLDLRLMRALAKFLGLADVAGLDEKIVPSERLKLDGLLVVWHPAIGGG